MKLLFCYDGPMAIDENNNAYPQTFTEKVLARYFSIADEVILIMRTKLIDPNSTELQKINIDRLRIVSCPNLSSIKGKFFDHKKAKKILKNEMINCDFIISRLPSQIGNLAIDMAIKLGKPYLVELVGCPWDALWNHSLKGKFVAPYMYFKTKKLVKDAKYVVYVTNEFLQKRYPTNGKSVNCSDVALKEFDDNVLINRLNKINSLKDSRKIVIGTTAAVDVRYKGQQYVIKALGELKKKGVTNYEYQLVGGGDQTYLKSIAEKYNVTDQVKFLGSIPHKKVFNWLDSIDIYVQPSRQEGLPRALIEAMSRGLPAFGANTAGIPELLESKYIFSNTRQNTKEICNILQSFTKDVMKEQAKRNYEEAKKYDKTIIEERRRQFFIAFKNSVKN